MAKKKAKSKRTAAKARAAAKPAKKKVMKKPARKVVKKVAKKKMAKKAAAPVVEQPQSKALAAGSRWVNPYLTVRDPAGAIRFYESGLGFKLRGKMEHEGKIMHAELLHNDSLVMLGPENPQQGGLAPSGPQSITLYTYVENVDEVTSRAATAGARVISPPGDMFWGDRVSIIVDPEGFTWWLATHIKDVSPEDMKPPGTSM